MKKIFYLALTGLVVFSVCSDISPKTDLPLEMISLPPGFGIALYAENVPSARSLTLGDDGTVFVGTSGSTVYALRDNNHDNYAEQVVPVAQRLNHPAGAVFYRGSLYVAEINRVLRYDDIENRLDNPPKPVVIIDTLPRDTHHGLKYLRVGPDGKLYIPVGMPCNICLPKDERYGTILRMNLDGSGLETAARGVRNSVGFDFNPLTGELWFTDNGRDWLGDNIPPDELNRISGPGLNFGFPYVYDNNIPDPDYGKYRPGNLALTPPAQELGPHVASLGMRFYTGRMFPDSYRNNIFIAEHGSWNRTVPIGYRITLVRLQGDRPVGYDVFAEGWRPRGQQAWGRPVDLLVLKDGSLLVSDDKAGVVYRISYGE
jgi:glucose/arabinose dehydrogenase